MFVASSTEFLSPEVPAWLAALRGQLADGGVGAPAEGLGPGTALQELDRVCETMLAGRGGPNEDDRKSLMSDIRMMRSAFGRHTAGAVGPTLNTFVNDLQPSRLATAQGARSVRLALGELSERLYRPETSQAAWDDVVDLFRDETSSPEAGEQRIAVLRQLCEARGHAWSGLGGISRRLTGLLSDDINEAVSTGAVESAAVSDWDAFAGLNETQRVAGCRELVAEEAPRAEVAVWLLFRNAYITGWSRLGPVDLFNAHLMPEGVRQGGNLEGIENYEPPPELADWETASTYLGDLGVPAGEHAVLVRVALSDSLVEQAPQRARELVETLVEVANDDSRWVLQEGEIAYRFDSGGWYGALGFIDPAQLEDARRAVNPVNEPTGRALAEFDDQFVERLATDDSSAAEAVEDALWVIAVSRAPTAAQRVALGTRALERTLAIAQAQGEAWPDVTTRYLLAPWLQLQRGRWVLAAAQNARLGVGKTHGWGSPLADMVAELVFQKLDASEIRPSAQGVARLEGYLGPLSATVAPGLIEHRILRRALSVLLEAGVALDWLKATQKRFEVLLKRTERCRNAIIHGQRPSRGTLATVDEFVRTLGRLVAQESMRSAETGDEPLAQLERWRAELDEQRGRLEAGTSPLDVLFTE